MNAGAQKVFASLARWVAPIGVAQCGPVAMLLLGLACGLVTGEFFSATPRAQWTVAIAALSAGALAGRWKRPRDWGYGLAATVVAAALLAACAPLLARMVCHLHELPTWSGWPTLWLLRSLGFRAALEPVLLTDGVASEAWTRPLYQLMLWNDGVVHRTSLTAEKHLPFCVVALALWVFFRAAHGSGPKRRALAALKGLGLIAVYLPARLVLVMLLAWEFDWTAAYWNPWLGLATYWPLCWLLARWLPMPAASAAASGAGRPWWMPTAATSGVVASALLIAGFCFHPAGQVKSGRVLMDDAHGNWEWSDISFDTKDYTQKAAYNYFCLTRFLTTYFDVSINRDQPLTAELLANVDVLVLKTPTLPYAPEEVQAVTNFVENGGGLYLVGDHTNLFGMSSYLGAVASRFGIEFVHDDTFDLITGQPTHFPGGLGWTHPIVAPMDYFEFETSCTLRCPPGSEVMVGYAMGSEWVDYGHVNFFGDIAPQADERWGGFVQMCAVDVGAGRVVAFSDSTVFSNFSMFFDDKPLLALRTIDWLNRRGLLPEGWRATGIFLAGVLLIVSAGVLLVGGALDRPRVLVALALAGVLVVWGLDRWSAGVQPNPTARAETTPPAWVDFDSRISRATLPAMLEGGDYEDPLAFDAFFVNLQRLELEPYVDNPLKLDRPPAFRLVINPRFYDPNDEHRHAESNPVQEVADWVKDGGVLLVLGQLGDAESHAMLALMEASGVRLDWRTSEVRDCIDSAEPHTHRVLAPPPQGQVIPLGDFVEGDVVDVRYGRGRAVFVTASRLFSRRHMGPMFKTPDGDELLLYEIEYALVRALLDGRPIDHAGVRERVDRLAELTREKRRSSESQPADSATTREAVGP